jgi:hypothetical protein
LRRFVKLLTPVGTKAGALLALLLLCPRFASATDYTTYHFDNARDGWNDAEVALTQTSVSHLTRSGDYPLDGVADAQPLYYHGLVYVATENDTVYAVDPRRGVVWRRHLGTPVPSRYVAGCAAVASTIGIQGTPVIDVAHATIDLVAYTLERGIPQYSLRALSLASGAQVRDADISREAGNTRTQRQRVGLLQASGAIYVAFGSFCDRGFTDTYGRIAAFDAASFAPRSTFVTTSSPRCRDYHAGTFWALGFAPAADARGNLYVATGNGCIDYRRIPNGGYSDAVLRLTPELRLTDLHGAFFAPCTALEDNRHDQEIGSAGVTLIPGTRFAIAGGKTGVTYVLDQAQLGGYHAPCPDRIVYERATSNGLWGGPAAWISGSQTFIAVAGDGPQGLREYAIAPSGRLTIRAETGVTFENGGEFPVISSNGSNDPQSSLLWVLTRPTTGTVYLEAYAATNLHHRLFCAAAGSWSNPGAYMDATPTVADGRVFVATDRELTVWSPASSRTGSARCENPSSE